MTLSRRAALATFLLPIGVIALVAHAEKPSTTTPATVTPSPAERAVPPATPPAASDSAAIVQQQQPASRPGPWRRPLEEGVYLAAFDENWDYGEIENPAPLPMCPSPNPNVVKFIDCCQGLYVYNFCNCFPTRLFSVCVTKMGQLTPPNQANVCAAKYTHPLFPGWVYHCNTNAQ